VPNRPEPVPEADQPPGGRPATPAGVELRHLRYLLAVAEAGTFTHAAERMFITQPTLSQQIRRLEKMVGTPLLDRRRDGVQLTPAGRVLLEESRTALSRLEHGLRRSRQAAGLERLRLRFVLPPALPGRLVADVALRLRALAAAAGVDVTWLEGPLEAEFPQVPLRQADSALGWLADPALLPDSLDAMTLGEFEPEAWLPAALVAGRPRIVGLDELARLDVVHGPRRVSPATYDAWRAALRARRPGFEFTDPPSGQSLTVALAFAAAAGRPTAVLSRPLHAAGEEPADAGEQQPDSLFGLVRVRLEHSPLTATAAVIWNGDLPRRLQQLLFDAADA
jgi:DNA-binding transcriptional LysR family regulator